MTDVEIIEKQKSEDLNVKFSTLRQHVIQVRPPESFCDCISSCETNEYDFLKLFPPTVIKFCLILRCISLIVAYIFLSVFTICILVHEVCCGGCGGVGNILALLFLLFLCFGAPIYAAFIIFMETQAYAREMERLLLKALEALYHCKQNQTTSESIKN